MFKALESFPIMPNNLLIDDGWQITVNRKLSNYGAQAYWLDGYESLGDVISKAKALGVERVGVWHTVLGYWAGVSRTSDAFKDFAFVTLKKKWGAAYDVIHPGLAENFFDSWYRQLRGWGVDFVKCDDMAEIEDMDSCVDGQGNPFPLRTLRISYVEAIRRCVKRYFSGRLIWYGP